MNIEEQNIERDFLIIEPLDNTHLIDFYKKYKNYFDNGLPSNFERQERYMTMLREIGNSYSSSGQHHEAIQVLKQAKKLLKSIGADNKTNPTYNSIIFCLANSNLAQKNYLSALSLFKAYYPSEKEKSNTKHLIQFCRDNIKSRILILAGSMGASILIIKYSIKWFSPDNYSSFVKSSGWFGAILLIAYGLIPIKTKNNHQH